MTLTKANQEIRACLLEVIAEEGMSRSNLQSPSVLTETRDRLRNGGNHSSDEAILTAFHDLFRTGYLAWGYNLLNPAPPFFHTTEQGRRSLETLSRDPSNPDGYLKYLSTAANVNAIASSYLHEALCCYVNDLPKAAAVMLGGATESIALELRDAILDRVKERGRTPPKGIGDWRLKTVLDCVRSFLEQNKGQMMPDMRESLEHYWPAFVQQIRSVRNEASHPRSVDPIGIEAVHASLLIFPELARLASRLLEWVHSEYH